MKQTLRYDQLSCRLLVEGLPDVSSGQPDDAVGIITSWTLEWAGRPQLEGRKEHLVALLQVVMPYARHRISGVARRFGDPTQPVEIGPSEAGEGHLLLLRSSQSETPPLHIDLDDAELADLVRVLDLLRMDPRLQIPLSIPVSRPLKLREVLNRTPWPQRLAAPMGGALVLGLATAFVLMLPQPKRFQSQPTSPAPSAQPTVPGARP
jgi:hypothetical protein